MGVADVGGNAYVSANTLVDMLAAAFLGPASAFVAAVLGEISASRVKPTRPQAVVINTFGAAVPALAAGTILQQEAFRDHGPAFYLTLAALTLAALPLCVAIIAPFFIVMDRDRESWTIRAWAQYAPSVGITALLTVAGASIYLKLGLGGITFALAAVGAFTYMAHLLERAKKRAEAHAALSWGVLAGLMRSLDIRDQRAARHAAAVARFARDMAQSLGMSERDQELAHTAGLLHDIGNFALSDRVAERGRTLSDEDWQAIQRHPQLGADMLRDLGLYGPVAEIVLCHHERLDGRGYPRSLPAAQIPEIAKIISVAEVYDTLTASDTYRTRMSSFEALRELRRVAGSQLDAQYVEVLAGLLSGEGIEYRHADAADFDTELDMERRIQDAGTG